MTLTNLSTIAAPRKGFSGHAVTAAATDPYHVAAAFTYRSLCSPKRLSMAWRINHSTARKYGRGVVIGALTRLLWEVVLLERHGIRTTRLFGLVRRTALSARREYEASLLHRLRSGAA